MLNTDIFENCVFDKEKGVFTFAEPAFTGLSSFNSFEMRARVMIKTFAEHRGDDACVLYLVPSSNSFKIMNSLNDINSLLLNNEGRFIYTYNEKVIAFIPFSEFVHNDINGEFVPVCCVKKYVYNDKTYMITQHLEECDLQCEHCEENIFSKEDHIITEDGSVFCSSHCAIESGYYQCERCGKWVSEDDIITPEDDDLHYCSDCASAKWYRCEQCANWYTSDDDGLIIYGDFYCCFECAEDADFVRCEDCGEWVSRDNAYLTDDDDCLVCNSCYEEREERKARLIKSYGYKPQYNFNATETDMAGKTLYFGAEVEVKFDDFDYFTECATALNSIGEYNKELIYLKSDCSLHSDTSFELVTMPCSLNWHKSTIGKEIFSTIFNEMQENKVFVDSDCGMHVHISRAGITEEQEISMELFMQLYKEDIEKIAGRKENIEYARFPDKYRNIKEKEYFTAYRNSSSRYRCINWENSRTVEIRIFASVTKYKDFMKNIEFCHAFYQYTKTVPFDTLEKLQFSDFIKYIAENADLYNHLHEFIINNF